jgi:hypothetical protein
MKAFGWCVVEISLTDVGGNVERGNLLPSANHLELVSRQKTLLTIDRVGRRTIRPFFERFHPCLFNNALHLTHPYYDRTLENK